MSFSSQIKEKLCDIEFTCPKCAVAESAGMFRTAIVRNSDALRLATENEYVSKRAAYDIAEGFGIEISLQKKTHSYVVFVKNQFEQENIKSMIFGDVTPFDCCKAAYIRGAFLGGGSVSDPNKNYHLEFCVKSCDEANYLNNLLTEMGISTGITERKGSFVVYVKVCEDIADLLGYMGAPMAALELFTVQVEKEMRNNINRRVNCESANADKMAKAASKHIVAIAKIKKAGQWEKLSEPLRIIGDLRCEYPEESLKELGEHLDPVIGKSGVNHRLNRILDFAETL